MIPPIIILCIGAAMFVPAFASLSASLVDPQATIGEEMGLVTKLMGTIGGLLCLVGLVWLFVLNYVPRSEIRRAKMMARTEAGIAAQRAGNIFLILIFLCTIIVLIIIVATGNLLCTVFLPLNPVFLLILRRAYIIDRLRKITQQ